LIASTIAASDVDLPEPVGPVTRTSPRGLRVNSWTAGGRPSSSIPTIVEGGADRRALEVGVDAEARVARDRVGEVQLPVRLQALTLVVAEDRVDDLARVGRRELRIALQPDQAAADADARRGAGRDVQVRRSAVDDVEEQVGEIEVHGAVRIGRARGNLDRVF
jgi:hypothetical protein